MGISEFSLFFSFAKEETGDVWKMLIVTGL